METIADENKRNFGIDLFRIISMLMVVTYHVMIYGKLLWNYPMETSGNYIFFGLRALVISSVNCYAIISGFVCCRNRFKLSKVFELWFQVFFFLLFNYFLERFVLGIPPESIKYLFFPVMSGSYWYFTAYFFIMMLMPFFNLAIEKMERKQHFTLCLILIVLFSIATIFQYGNLWGLNGGFSGLWLGVLYFLGAYYKKYGLLKIRKTILLAIFFVSAILIFLSFYFLRRFPLLTKEWINESAFFEYSSIFVVIQSVSLLHIFAELKLKNKFAIGLIRFISPLTFGVYLIHESVFFRDQIMAKLIFILQYSNWLLIPLVLFVAIIIFLGCSFIEYARKLLFKWTRFDRFLLWGGSRLQALCGKWLNRTCSDQDLID